MGERRAFLGLIASLVGSAWCALWIWGRSPYGRYLGHEQLGEIGAGSLLLPISLYLVGWTLMTVAMMLPTTLPLLEIFRRLTAQRQDRSQLLALVIAGYLAVWMGFGIAARTHAARGEEQCGNKQDKRKLPAHAAHPLLEDERHSRRFSRA